MGQKTFSNEVLIQELKRVDGLTIKGIHRQYNHVATQPEVRQIVRDLLKAGKIKYKHLLSWQLVPVD